MVSVLQPLEFGDVDHHPFHGNQYTGGFGDGKAGPSGHGDAGNNILRSAMAAGLQDKARAFGDSVYDPTSEENRLIDSTSTMRQAAKAEVVAAAGADIAKAAENDPAVRAEFETWAEETLAQSGMKDDWKASSQEERNTFYPDINPQAYGEAKAQEYVDQWAHTASGSDPLSLSLQEVTAETLSAHSDSFDRYLDEINEPRGTPKTDTLLDREGDTMRAFVQGEYDRTQAFLKDNGITEVTLHRGFTTPTPFPESGSYPIEMNPASSWSVDMSTASQFAGNPEGDGAGYLLTMSVPASDIISTARTGQGALHEGEVIVRNQPGHMAYVSMPEES